MPTVVVDMFQGRIKNDEQKRELVRRITDAIADTLELDPELVRIRINVNDPAWSARGGVLRTETPG